MEEIDYQKAKYPAFSFHFYKTAIGDTKLTYTILAINQPDNPHNPFEHTHSEFELIFLLKGQMTCIINQREHLFDQPTAILLPPGLTHATNVYMDECFCLSWSFLYQVDEMTEIKRFLYEITQGGTTFVSCAINETMYCQLMNMYQEHRKCDQFSAEKVNAYFALIFVGLLEEFVQFCPNFTFKKKQEENWDSAIHRHLLSKQLIDYININCSCPISVNDLAVVVHMSVGNLQRILNNFTGKTFTELLREARINRAKGMIWRTKYELNEIAEMCGYGSYEYFYKQFRQTVGLSPQEYRMLSRSEPDCDLEITETNEIL